MTRWLLVQETFNFSKVFETYREARDWAETHLPKKSTVLLFQIPEKDMETRVGYWD